MKNYRCYALALGLVALMGLAQSTAPVGAISGTLFDSIGDPIGNNEVQAENADTHAVFKATTSAKGKYTLADLPPGKYYVVASAPGLKPFAMKGVVVQAALTLRFDIRLGDTTQLNTLGEDRLRIAADNKRDAPPTAPTPRTYDGKPDLSGVWWQPRTVDPGKPEFLPAALAIPVGGRPAFPQIYRGGPTPPADPNPAWYGHSIGRWDGGTLVVDRVGFDPRVWLDVESHPHSDKLHIVERYHRPDLGHLEIEITVDDPGVLAKPWTQKRVADLAHEEIFEYICQENNTDVGHLVGK